MKNVIIPDFFNILQTCLLIKEPLISIFLVGLGVWEKFPVWLIKIKNVYVNDVAFSKQSCGL